MSESNTKESRLVEKEEIIIPVEYKNKDGKKVVEELKEGAVFYNEGEEMKIQKVMRVGDKMNIYYTDEKYPKKIKNISFKSWSSKYTEGLVTIEKPEVEKPPLLEKKPGATKKVPALASTPVPASTPEVKKPKIVSLNFKTKTPDGERVVKVKQGETFFKLKDDKFVEYKVNGFDVEGKDGGYKVAIQEVANPDAKEEVFTAPEFQIRLTNEKIKLPIEKEVYAEMVAKKEKSDAVEKAKREAREAAKNKKADKSKKTNPVIAPTTTSTASTPTASSASPAKPHVIIPRISPSASTAYTVLSKGPGVLPRKLAKNERNDKILSIGELLKIGVDRVVIHGKDIKNEDGEKQTIISPDTDTLGALYLLNNSFDPNKKPNIKYNLIETVGKGQETTATSGVILHIDVGGKNLSIEKDGKVTKIFVDHHGEDLGRHTSATAMVYDILNKNRLLKERPKWMNSFVNFVDNVDNLAYIDRLNKEGKKIFNKQYFLNTWPYSLQGIYDKVPFKTLVSLFEKYPDRNPNKPFTDEEIKGELGNIKINETETLADICKKRKGEVGIADFGVNRAVESMKERDIETENKTLGKFVYHDYAKYKTKNKKEYVVTIPNALGFLATKANGYDTYVVYNSKKKNFFVNSTTKELKNIQSSINKIIPGTKLIRGVFIFPPTDYEKMKETLTGTEFKKCLDIRENVTLSKDPLPKSALTISPDVLPPKGKEIAPDQATIDLLRENIEKFADNPVIQNIFIKRLEALGVKAEDKKNLVVEEKKKEAPEEKKKREAGTKELETKIKTSADEFEKSREKYITEYKKSLEAKKSTTMVGRWFNKAHDAIFGAKVAEGDISAELKKNKLEWDNASEKYQRLLQEKYKAEYTSTGHTVEEAERYAKGKILGEVVMKNIWATRQAEAEKWPPEKKNIWGKAWELWRKTPATKKVMVSCGIFAVMGMAGGMAMGALATGVTWKALRSLTASALTAQSARVLGGYYKKDEEKKTQSLKSLQEEFVESDMDPKTYLTKYEEVIEREMKANRKRLGIKMGIAFAIGAGTILTIDALDSMNNAGAPDNTQIPETKPLPEPIPEPTSPNHFSSDAIIRKNEGIEHAFRRQIEHDPALQKYFAGRDAGSSAHLAALKLGYVDGHGGEVRVGMPGVGYKLEVDPSGELISHEINGSGKIIDVDHHEGESFESSPDQHEYSYGEKVEPTSSSAETSLASTDIARHEPRGDSGEPSAESETIMESSDDTPPEASDVEETTTETKVADLPFDDQVAIRTREDLDRFFTKHNGLTTIPGPDTATWKDLSTTDSWTFMKKLTSKGYDDPQVYNFGEYFYHLAKEYNFTDENVLKGKTVAEVFQTLESKAQADGFK